MEIVILVGLIYYTIVIISKRNKVYFKPNKQIIWEPTELKNETLKYKNVFTTNRNYIINIWSFDNPLASKVIVYCYGNSGNMSSNRLFIEFWKEYLSEEYSLIMFDYIGFGKSQDTTGEVDYPTIDSCKMSLYITLKYTFKNFVNHSVSLYGFSMGGGIISEVVSELEYEFDKVILSHTFTSVRDFVVEKNNYFLFVYYFIPNELDTFKNLNVIKKTRKSKILLIGSKQDGTIPYHMFNRLSTLVDKSLTVKGDHNNIFTFKENSQNISQCILNFD